MKFKLYAILFVGIFLFVAYWFVAHSFVFVRLISALGFLLFIALVIAALMGVNHLFGRKNG